MILHGNINLEMVILWPGIKGRLDVLRLEGAVGVSVGAVKGLSESTSILQKKGKCLPRFTATAQTSVPAVFGVGDLCYLPNRGLL
jgi:hypothetical protein